MMGSFVLVMQESKAKIMSEPNSDELDGLQSIQLNDGHSTSVAEVHTLFIISSLM